jgi:hypothetical protein
MYDFDWSDWFIEQQDKGWTFDGDDALDGQEVE